MTSRFAALVLIAAAAAANPGCSCQASEQCQLIRALCKLDLCRKTDTAGWAYCDSLPDACDPIERCTPRSECLTAFMDRCTGRMVPGALGYSDYAECAVLDCSGAPAPPPPASPVSDATLPPDAAHGSDAAPPPPMCAGVLCDGACCTAYPCFTKGHCTCVTSVSACKAPGGGGDVPPFSPTCCSDAPLCSAQNKVCCFVPASAGLPAQTRCLASCPDERHCVTAPFQRIAGGSCLPPILDTAGTPCPF